MSRGLAFASLLLLTLTAEAVRAECVRVTPKQLLDAPGTELVFSGRVVELIQSGEYGAQVRFEVGRVWKGRVTERFSIFMWYGDSAEAPRYERGRSYAVVARRLTDKRARGDVGLGASDSVAFTGVMCSGDYSAEEFVRGLGRGKPPVQEAGQQLKH